MYVAHLLGQRSTYLQQHMFWAYWTADLFAATVLVEIRVDEAVGVGVLLGWAAGFGEAVV